MEMSADAKRALEILEGLTKSKAKRAEFNRVYNAIVDLLRDEVGDPLMAYLVLSFARDQIRDSFHLQVILKEHSEVFSAPN